MAILHDETRARWTALDPEKFITTVIHGELRTQIKLTYTFIAVYTQIIHSQPKAHFAGVQQPDDSHRLHVDALRDLLKYMRACITDAKDIVFGDGPTLPMPYTHMGYILYIVSDIRRNIEEIERCAMVIETDAPLNTLVLPALEGRSAGNMAEDIRARLVDVKLLLDFAQSYAEKLQEKPRSKPG
jgi:hypothetical protein